METPTMQSKIYLPDSFLKLFDSLESVFTKPSYPYFLEFIKGILICGKRRCVTRFFRLSNLTKHFTDYHRFLNRYRWDVEKLSFGFLKKLLLLLGPRDLAFALDDTLVSKYGPKIYGRGVHFDHANRGNLVQYVKGHTWVVCGLLHHVPIFCKWICFPFIADLFVPEKITKKDDKFKTKIELGSLIIKRLKGSLGRRFTMVTDAFYAKRGFVQTCISNGVVMVSRIRHDAALYGEVKEKRKPGRGRPRKYGKRISSLVKLSKERKKFKKLKIKLYNKVLTLPYREVIGYWKPAGTFVKVVIVAYPTKRGETVSYFFSTDTKMSVERILRYVSARWSLENAFKDMKQHLGFNDWQCRKKEAVLRSITLNCIAYSALLLWSKQELEKGCPDFFDTTPWNINKRNVSLQDMLEQLKGRCVSKSILLSLGENRINSKKLERIKSILKLAA
jgi:SRSO17 transposase